MIIKVKATAKTAPLGRLFKMMQILQASTMIYRNVKFAQKVHIVIQVLQYVLIVLLENI